jgi:PAS domain S-box-containing protein
VRQSLRARFLFSIGLFLTVLIAIITFAVSNRVERLLLRETAERGLAVAHSMGASTMNALLNYDYVSLNQVAQKAVEESDIAYVVILDKERVVAAHTARPEMVGRPIPESTRAQSLGAEPVVHETTFRSSGSVQRVRVLDIATPVFLDGSDVQWGTVRIGLDLEPVIQELTRVRMILVAIGVAAILVAFFVASLISRRIISSINHLVQGTIAVSQGNLDHKIDVDTGDEIAMLANHFNHMTAQVKQKQDEIAIAKQELEILNATLEDKVTKRTHEFLASEEKYRILVENSPDPILIVQGDQVRFVNPAFNRVFGQNVEGLVREGFPVADLFLAEDRTRASERIAAILRGNGAEATEVRGGDAEVVEVRGIAKGQKVRQFEMWGMRISYLGAPAVEIILHDTTERKELHNQLVQHEKLRALGQLAGGVAHDFNNTLGIILGRAQLLQRSAREEALLRGLKTIEKAAFDGGETVRRIQDFARARTGRDFTDVDVNAILEDAVEITRTRWKDEAELRNVKIDVEVIPGEIRNIKGNASELREVYTNLIFNAVDAMVHGGRIRLESAMDGADTMVVISDTGQGMSEDVRARVFDPFFTTKGQNGMGLGLSVVYGIVERHGGRISVDSEVGRGTRFTVRIPAAEISAQKPLEESQCMSPKSAKILVIDDEEDILDLVSDILTESGYEVRTARSGPIGIEMFQSQPCDLLFCDLGMREMSGWEVVTALRAHTPNLCVVLLTGWGATLPEEKVREYQISAVLSKPFEMTKLLKTVAQVLDTKEREQVTG